MNKQGIVENQKAYIVMLSENSVALKSLVKDGEWFAIPMPTTLGTMFKTKKEASEAILKIRKVDKFKDLGLIHDGFPKIAVMTTITTVKMV